MRILHVSDVYLPRLGGIERQVADLAAQQRIHGDLAHVLTSTKCRDGAVEDIPARDDVVTRASLVTLRAGRVFTEIRPDVVHCHTSIVSPLAWAAARQAVARGLPTVVTMHSVAQHVRPMTAGLRAVAGLVGPGALWTAVSQVAAAALMQAVERPVHVLPNGIDPTMWRTSAVGSRDTLTVVSVMRLVARKRPFAFLDVMSDVDRRVAGQATWRAVIAGSGPQRSALAREIRRRGLRDVVLLPGRLDRAAVAGLLSAADLYVAPAALESFGIAALEARCSGLPVVGVRGAGVGEFVTPGVHGELVVDDTEMAETISGLLLDRDWLSRLARGARMPVSHTWEAALARCDELYELAGCETGRTVPTVTQH